MDVAEPTSADSWDHCRQGVPRPSGEPGTRAYFDAAERHRAFLFPHIAGFADFPRWQDKRVLEIGCGIGIDAVNFCRAGAEYTGIDLSAARLRQARQWCKLAGVDARLVQCDARQLLEQVRQTSFDLIFCFDTMHDLADPDAVIRQARRAIRPDGEFRLMLPAKGSWEDATAAAGLPGPIGIGRRYSRTEARSLLRINDFAVTAIVHDHIFPYNPDAYSRGEYAIQPWFAAMPRAMFRALEQRFGAHMLITARPS